MIGYASIHLKKTVLNMPDTLKTTFWRENLAQWWKQSGHFSQESGNIDQNTSCAHLWVWLNMDQYPWICVIIIENAWINCSDCCKCQSSEYTWLSYMFDRLLKMPQILNKPEFQICLIMTSYASIMPEGTSI